MSNLAIRGAGGGGGKGGSKQQARSPVEVPDTLRSKQLARIIDGICEGEIEGFPYGAKGVFYDQTPLQNEDGTFNFKDVDIEFRNGTQSQSYIPGYPSVESETEVNLQVHNPTPIVRTVSDEDVDAVRVTISIPQLTFQNLKTGDRTGHNVTFAIDVQSNGGGYATRYEEMILGKTTNGYQKSVTVNLTGTAPWDIRVRRVSADNTAANIANDLYWSSYTTIYYDKLRYPNIALAATVLDSSQFSRIPVRGYLIRGLRVKVPSNYDPATRTYTGVWDGSFKIAWTDNPVWCTNDMLINTRYGLGKYIREAYIDKWQLYTIAQYCDELVADGFGGVEPRYRMNLYLQTREDAYKVITAMASSFRAMTYWHTGAVSFSCDMPADPVALFSNSNVIDGMFTYSGSAKAARHTVALVTWNDPDDFYRQKVEYVEDTDGILRYGVHETEVIAVGCTSRGQAHRFGKWSLYTELYETDTVTFKTGLEGLTIFPGAIIKVQDADRAGVRWSGRILGVSEDQLSITIDAPVTLDSLSTYTLSLINVSGEVITRTLTNPSGETNSLTFDVTVAGEDAAADWSVWILESEELVTTMWRVISITEDNKTTAAITALEYHPGKYDFIEKDIALEERPTSLVQTVPPVPQNIQISDTIRVNKSGDIVTTLNVSWDQIMPTVAVAGEIGFSVDIQPEDGNWQSFFSYHNSIDIDHVRDGVMYQVVVSAVNSLGYKSQLTEPIFYTVQGKLAPPSAPTNLSVVQQGNVVTFKIDPVSDPDLDYIEIAYSDLFTGDYALTTPIGNITKGNSLTSANVLPGTWKFWARSYDTSGNGSTEFATVEAFIDSGGYNLIQRRDEAPDWLGTKINFLKHPQGSLVPNNTVLAASVGYNTFDQTVINPEPSCSYESLELNKGLNTSTRIWVDTEQSQVFGGAGTIEPEVSMDFRTSDGVYDGFEPWSVGVVFFQYARAKIEVDTTVGTGIYTLFEIATDNFSRVESRQSAEIAAAGTDIYFIEPFNMSPNVQITLLGGTFATRYEVTKFNDHIHVKCFDVSNVGTLGYIDWRAEGV